MISPPAVSSSPILQRSKRGWPKQAGAKLDQILLCGQDEIGAQLRSPNVPAIEHPRPNSVMIGEDPQIAQLLAQGEQGAPKSFWIADTAKRRDRLSLESDLAETRFPRRRSSRVARAGPQPNGSGPAFSSNLRFDRLLSRSQ